MNRSNRGWAHPAPRADTDRRKARFTASSRPSASRATESTQELADLAESWLADVRMRGRSPRTIDWYQQKVATYLNATGATTLNDFTAGSVRTYIGSLQERRLGENTVHGCFQVLRTMANWADREGYDVDPGLLRLGAPKLPELEVETYSQEEIELTVRNASPAWARLAVQILAGTGLRLSELCALQTEDFEDTIDATFLKVRRGKGSKFRRVPVSPRLRKAIERYLRNGRPESTSPQLLVLRDARPVSVAACSRMLHRLGRTAGCRVHAHKFRHTFATAYLRNGGDIERLRRILGHTTYAMVMRYVHLRGDDLYRDFEHRAPF